VKAILITGSSQGIGLGIAKYYATREFHICVNYHENEKRADDAIAELRDLGATPTLHRADVTVEPAVKEMYDEIDASGHQLETVVVNATHEIPKPIDEVTFEEWHRVLLTKLDGAFLAIKYAIPLLAKADNPAIVVITSSEGWRPDGEYLAYQVGTAGLISIMIGNSRYLCNKYRIRVNAVAPGPVHSGLWEKAGESDEMWQEFAQKTPTGRVATTDDVAAAVWYLAEDPQKFLNGTTVNVDGGKQWI
jgi:NAD(P)-dependent dehydrogenase (short-subunit alcohol dehydrogenase family)